MAQLRIILPLTQTYRADRPPHPSVGRTENHHVTTSVPELLQPYIPQKDWIEFCDKLTDANASDRSVRIIRNCIKCLIPSMIWFGVVFLVLMENPYVLVACPTVVGCMCVVYYYLASKTGKIINAACSELSNKLKTVTICYHHFETPKRTARDGTIIEVDHAQLDLFVSSDGAPRSSTQTPYQKFFLRNNSRTFRQDDHWAILGGTTGCETLDDFAAAYHRACRYILRTGSAEVVPSSRYGGADNHGNDPTTEASDKDSDKFTTLVDQLETGTKGGLADELLESWEAPPQKKGVL